MKMKRNTSRTLSKLRPQRRTKIEQINISYKLCVQYDPAEDHIFIDVPMFLLFRDYSTTQLQLTKEIS